VSAVQRGWPTGPDNFYLMGRIASLVPEVAAAAGCGRVLEVAAAEAVHSCKMNRRGMEAFVVEPSAVMMEHARARMRELGARVHLIRGVAETLPFADATFERVLIDSAIDHLSQPELSLEEMTRVLKADGRLIVSFVNYQSLSTRVSRFLYAAGRGLRVTSRNTLFWDTPVPVEHTFECTYDVILRLCEPYLELDQIFGVSLGWMMPGWGSLLKRLPRRRVLDCLQRLDAIAYRRPRLADFVVAIWRPRPLSARRPPVPVESRTDGPTVVRPSDIVYPGKAKGESEYWASIDFGRGFFAVVSGGDRMVNEAYTGDPERSWLDDLIDRGPFVHAAMLGCDEGGYEEEWLRREASARLDVYELSPGVIRQLRTRLGWRLTRGPRRRVRFICTDLNFALLPENHYDVIWSSGCLHHIVNLEHVLAQVERALRPDGLFAIRDYVGEPRMQFAAHRLARINAILRQVPARYRRIETVSAPPIHRSEVTPPHPSPFCGVRANEILPLAEARFDVVHKGVSGALFPLNFAVDLDGLARDAPDAVERLRAAEEEALRDPLFPPCGAYVVLRKRSREHAS
jgi:SAM-dependent methyltransferase